jgi:hypothetical protein
LMTLGLMQLLLLRAAQPKVRHRFPTLYFILHMRKSQVFPCGTNSDGNCRQARPSKKS